MPRALLAGVAVAVGLAVAPGPARAHGAYFYAAPGPVVVVPQVPVYTYPARPVIVVPQGPVIIAPGRPVYAAPPAVVVAPFCCAVAQPQFRGATGLGGPGRSGWVR
jgi:hypothetical protein